MHAPNIQAWALNQLKVASECVGVLFWQTHRHACCVTVHHRGGKATNTDRTRDIEHHSTSLNSMIMHVQAGAMMQNTGPGKSAHTFKL